MICLIIKIRNSLSTQIIRKFTFGSHGRRFSEIEDMCCVLESAPSVCLLFTFALLLRPWCSWYLPVFATTADNLSLLFHRGLWPFRSCLMVPFTFLPLSSFLMIFYFLFFISLNCWWCIKQFIAFPKLSLTKMSKSTDFVLRTYC